MLGYPKLYKRDELNKLLTGDLSGTYKKYWNNALDFTRAENLPKTQNGCTWSRNADGSIHCEGTLTAGYTSWYTRHGNYNTNEDLSLIPGHCYLAPRKTSFQSMTYTDKQRTDDLTYIKIDTITSGQNPRLYYAFTGEVGDVINENAEAPWIIDITAIYGYGNEPATIDANLIKLAKYARKHPEYKQDVWYIDGKKWTWRKYYNGDGTSANSERHVFCETKFACSGGDTIMLKWTSNSGSNLCLIYEYAADGTFVKRTAGVSPSTVITQASTAYYMFGLYNNNNITNTAEYIAAANVKTAIVPNNYNNKYDAVNGADTLPYTLNGVTFSRNADGTIHIEGTVGSAQSYSQWYFCSINKNNYFLVPGHYYYQNYGLSDITHVSLNQYPISVSNKAVSPAKGRIFKLDQWNGTGTNHWYDYAGLSYIVLDSGTTVNADVPAPVVVDLTDIFGYGQEPISLSDSRMINLINYIDIVGTGYEATKWLIDGNRWTYCKHYMGSSNPGYNQHCNCLEQDIAVNPGDTITINATAGILFHKYINYFNGSTFLSRSTLDATQFTDVVPANATKAIITINNNHSGNANTPSNLDAINFSVSVTPAPTPSSHAVNFSYPITLQNETYGDITITGAGTYTGTGEIGTSTLVVNSSGECEYTLNGSGAGMIYCACRINEIHAPSNEHLEAGKKYRIAMDMDYMRSEKLYEMAILTDFAGIKNSDPSTTDWLDYALHSGLDEDTFEYYENETPIDCTSLSAGDYYILSPTSPQSMLQIMGYVVKVIDGQPVYPTSYTFKFALALDEVE